MRKTLTMGAGEERPDDVAVVGGGRAGAAGTRDDRSWRRIAVAGAMALVLGTGGVPCAAEDAPESVDLEAILAGEDREIRDDATAALVSGTPADESVAAAPAGKTGARVERLTLGECIRRALAAAPDLDVARKDVAAREAKLEEVKISRFLPEAQAINITGIARRARGTVTDPKDTVDVDAYGVFTRVEVNLVQPLFVGGKITAGIAAATHAVEAQMAASDGVAADVIEQVKKLYYNILLARSVTGTLEEARDAFGTALKTARERRDEGDAGISELDILYLRVGLAQTAKEIPKLEYGANTALSALRRLMGASSSSPIDIADQRLEPVRVHLRPAHEYAEMLFEKNPGWRQLDQGVLAKAEEVRTVEADFYPAVFLTGSFAYAYAPRRDRQLNPFAYDDYNFLNGPGGVLGIRWLLNFHITAARAQTARAELEKLESQRRQAQSGLPLELEDAYAKAVQARETVEALEDGRKAGRAILTLAVTNFDVGVGEARDILDGLGSYARVSSDYYEAVRDYDLALAALSRVLGEEVTDLVIPVTEEPLAGGPGKKAKR